MFRIIKHWCLSLCRRTPQHIHNRSVLHIDSINNCIRKLLPAVSLMWISLMCSYRKNRVEKKYSLLRPFHQIAVAWDITSTVIMQFFIYILKWRRCFLSRKYWKRQSMCLMYIMIRILTKYQYLNLTKRCKMKRIKYIICRRIYNIFAVFITNTINF